VLASRSRALQDIVHFVTRRINIKDSWQYELAAKLCLLSCLSLPEEVFEKGYRGAELSLEEDEMYRAHPKRAALLLSNIPRLEAVAEMIRRQQRPEEEPSVPEEVRRGSQLLDLALQLDRRVWKGDRLSSSLDQLKLLRRFDASMLVALESYAPPQPHFEVRRLPIRDLRAAMVLEEDIASADGKSLLLKKGTVLTETWIERLGNFAKTLGTQDQVYVGIPG
jgi:hypothetical protein